MKKDEVTREELAEALRIKEQNSLMTQPTENVARLLKVMKRYKAMSGQGRPELRRWR